VSLRSLHFRLLAAAAISISLALVLAGLGLVVLFEHHVQRRLDAELEADLRELIGRIELGAGGRVRLNGDLTDPRFAEPLSGLYWQIQDDQRPTLLRSRSLWDGMIDLPKDELSLGVVHRHELTGPLERPLLVREQQVILHPETLARRLRIAVAIDRSDLLAARQAFTAELVPYLALLAAALLGATWFQVRMGLSPLDQVRRGVLAISSGQAQRLPDTFPDEVMPLIDEINTLLAARDQAVESARAWTADLAHGLKTPLSALGADAQRLRERGERELADSLDALAQGMRRRVDRELIRARLRTASPRLPQAADLVRIVRGVVATIARTPAGEALHWRLDLPQALTVGMPPDDLAELLGNLLDNASKWARSQVRVRLADPSGLELSIEDDGPGVPEAEMARLGQRGLRLDEQTSGSGLGLAIARDILAAYGGRLALARSELGGLAAFVTLPALGRLPSAASREPTGP
jgi:signal transduction histidine kinase